MPTAALIMQINSEGYLKAEERLRRLAEAGDKAEKASLKLASTTEKSADKEWQAYQKAEAKREAMETKRRLSEERDFVRRQTSYEKQWRAAEAAYAKQAAASEKAAKREEDAWINAIQRAKARAEREGWGRDGVLPIRPSLQRIEARLGQGTESAGLGSSLGGLAGAAGLAIGVGSIALGARRAVQESAAYEGLIARLNGVTGSAEAATKAFKELDDASNDTIYSENQFADAFINLDNAGLKPTVETLKSLANIASATGNSIDAVSDSVIQAGLGNYRSLRQMGIKVEAEGNALKVSFRGTETSIENSSKAISDYLERIGKVEFAGAAARQLDTMGGSVKKLEDAWGDMFREIGRGAIGDLISTGMKEAAKLVELLTDDINALFGATKRVTVEMGPLLKKFVSDASSWGKDEGSADFDSLKSVLADLEKTSKTPQQAAFEKYLEQRNVILDSVAKGFDFDSKAALADLEDRFRREVGGGSKVAMGGSSRADAIAFVNASFGKIEAGNQAGLNARADAAAEAGAREYEAIKAALTKQEDIVKASYERQREYLQQYTGEDSAELLAANEAMWASHNAKLREQEESSQRERDKKIADIAGGEDGELAQIRFRAAAKFEALREVQDEEEKLRGIDLDNDIRYQQAKTAIARQAEEERSRFMMAQAELGLASTANTFATMAELAKKFSGEQSTTYKVMFAASKGFVAAETGVKLVGAAANALDAPWPANLAAWAQVVAIGAQLTAQLAGIEYYDEGGTIAGGRSGIVGERDWELVRGGAVVQGPAQVIGREDTARLLSGGGHGGATNLTVNNLLDLNGMVRAFAGMPAFGSAVMNVVGQNRQTIRSLVSD